MAARSPRLDVQAIEDDAERAYQALSEHIAIASADATRARRLGNRALLRYRIALVASAHSPATVAWQRFVHAMRALVCELEREPAPSEAVRQARAVLGSVVLENVDLLRKRAL
jgi:hypothetical protein